MVAMCYSPQFSTSITYKNEELLKQIILFSSKEGDIVLDCFCGSGTILVAAEKLKRFSIGLDSNKFAIETSKKKLAASNTKQQDLFRKPLAFSPYEAI